MAIADLPKAIEITGRIAITETTNEARLSCAQSAGVARVQWSSLLEARTCPLCAALDGKVFEAAKAEFNPPAHINCNCIWVERGDDEVGPVDWFDPGEPGSEQEQEWVNLIGRHGHFLHDEETYAPLRIPAGPTGRDFTFRRRRNPETGQPESVIEWKRPRYDLGDLTVGGKYTPPAQIGVTEVGERWEPLGGEDLPGPAGGGVPPAPEPPLIGAGQMDAGDADLSRFEPDDPRNDLPEIDRAVPVDLAERQTPAEIEGWIRDRWTGRGLPADVSFELGDGAPEVLRPMMAQIDRLAEDWPGVARTIRRVHVDTNLPEGAIAWSETGDVAMNPRYLGNRDLFRFRKVRLVEEAYYHSGAGSFAETMTHEFGHQVLYAVAASDDVVAQDMVRDWLVAHRTADFTVNVEMDSSGMEAWAEAFSLRYHVGNEVSQPAVQELWELLDRLAERGF